MTHDRRFRPTDGTFENTFPNYYGAGLVTVVLRIADVMATRFRRSQEDGAGVFVHLFSELLEFAFGAEGRSQGINTSPAPLVGRWAAPRGAAAPERLTPIEKLPIGK